MYAESLRHYLKPVVEHLDDPAVTEIMINGPEDIWIERKGRVIKLDVKFTVEGLEAAARNMAQYVGRMLNDERPRLDARLPDGSRIHVVMPPIARKGCTVAIRKFFPDKLTVEKLIEFGSMTPAMARFIDACVNVKENIVVSGGTGSGKTTLLNCVAQYIPDDERILTIEDSAELQLNQEHLVPFESRPPDKFGKGKVDMGDLLHSALRLRPDRIVVGEVRGGEAFHLMQAMNTGHGGSLATVHANTPSDTLRRLESLCLQSGIELPMVAVRSQVASAINIVIVCGRLQDGQRKSTHISEVLPLDDRGDYRTQDLFVFTPTHKDSEGNIHGYHAPTGLLPTFLDRLAPYGFGDIDESFFDPATYDVEPPPIFTASEGYRARWAPSLAHRERGEEDPAPRPRPSGGSAAQGEPERSKKPAKSTASGSADRPDTETAARPSSAAGRAPEGSADQENEPPTGQAPLGHASLEMGSEDEEESTDPSLVEPAPEPETVSAPDPKDGPPDPKDGPEADPKEEVPDLESQELAAIEAALAEDPDAESSEPSIQLADDFAAEAAEHTRRAPMPEEPPQRLRPRVKSTKAAAAAKPRPTAGRRRRGGVVGRPGDPE